MSRSSVTAGQVDTAKAAATVFSQVQAQSDLRFRSLLSTADWQKLPAAVRVRFSKKLCAGKTVTYNGEIVESRMSRVGWLLAQLLRVVGGPLPLSRDTDVPATVVVAEDQGAGGQFWTRIYYRRCGFAQCIQSSKRFAGPTGLEEYIGFGFGMGLTVEAGAQGLYFHSHHYFFQYKRWRVRLPALLTPGAITVGHVDCSAGWFAFTLDLHHQRLGELLHQTIMFRDE